MQRPFSVKALSVLHPGGLLPYLLLLCSVTVALPALALAADFAGNLGQVKITDAAGTNQPPTASFTYSIDNGTVTFDANTSSDPDGSITRYKWDFGDGTTSEGVTTAHAAPETNSIKVTLSVIDNAQGIALTQQTINPVATGINDDFSHDTTSDYTIIFGNFSIYDGAAHTLAWKKTIAIMNKSIQSTNHSVSGDIFFDGSSASTGLVIGADLEKKSGFVIYISRGTVNISKFVSSSFSWIASYNGSYTSNNYHVTSSISNNTISVSINGIEVISKPITNDINGQHIGMFFPESAANDLLTIDNLTATSID
jgi:PKD repeat protein